MTALEKPAIGSQTSAMTDNDRIEKALDELLAEHRGHARYTDICKSCIYKAAFMLDQGSDEEREIAREYLGKISLPVVNEAIATVDFALDMKGLVKPFVAGELVNNA